MKKQPIDRDRARPIEITGITNARSIAVGARHVCALLAGGTVQCWGANSAGQLGRGTNDDSDMPAAVIGISGAESIASGDQHTCARFSNGTAKCWGQNGVGSLGDGTTTSSSNVPVSVVSLP